MPKTIFYLLKGDFRLESSDAQPARTPWQVERPRGLAAALLPMWVPFCFLGVPIIRTIVFWGLYWGPLILGTYHLSPSQKKFRSSWP